MKQFGIEPEFKTSFEAWQLDPNKANSSAMLKHLKPAISRGITAHAGKNPSPTIHSHARKLTLGALKTYESGRSALSTHVINHLQGLKRIQRHQTQVFKTPERVMLDRARLDEAETSLEDRLGYEPSLMQLADFTGLSTKRIGYVRRFQSPMAQGQFTTGVGASGETEGSSPAVENPESMAWIEVVYGDQTPLNQKIMEWTIGLRGKPLLSNQEIAKRLRLTPGAISQRKSHIQELLNQENELSPF